MRIKGVQKTTLLDFPGHIACTVFTPGCNFKCGFCYNKSIVNDYPELEDVPEEEFFEFLKRRQNILEGVAVSGGEPTLQKDLADFLAKIRRFGFKTKLDTNGTNPEILKELFEKKLVNYVAMDIKGPLEDYGKICRVKFDTGKIKESIALVKDSGVSYEFRTTILPEFHSRESFGKIAELLKGSEKYFLQQFSPVDSLLDESLRSSKRFSKEDFEEFKKILEKSISKVEFRNLD